MVLNTCLGWRKCFNNKVPNLRFVHFWLFWKSPLSNVQHLHFLGFFQCWKEVLGFLKIKVHSPPITQPKDPLITRSRFHYHWEKCVELLSREVPSAAIVRREPAFLQRASRRRCFHTMLQSSTISLSWLLLMLKKQVAGFFFWRKVH